MVNAHGTIPRYRYTKQRYRLLFGIVDRICFPLFRFCLPRERVWPEPRSILVVQLDHIGDAVLTTPMLSQLKKRFPRASLDVLASDSNQELFRADPSVDHVIVSRQNWHARGAEQQSWLPEVLRLARQIRCRRYDWAMDPRGDFLVILLLWLAAIPRRIGWECGGGGFMMTDTAPWDPTRHELDSRRTLLAALGVRPAPDQFYPEVFPSWADVYHVREWLHAVQGLRSPLAVIHVGAGTSAKRWPVASWSRLVHKLLDRLAGSILLVGTADDRWIGRKIARRDPRVVDWTGRLTLMQTAALCREADLFVGCDSGPAHVAAALGVPCVVLFSGTNRAECWRPVGQFVHVLRHSVACAPCHQKLCPIAGHPCMEGITEQTVVSAALSLINESSAYKTEHEAFRSVRFLRSIPTGKAGT
jgi:lipopolysaccharide heptosyltransferase II